MSLLLKCLLLAAWLLQAISAQPAPAAAANETCNGCHEQQEKLKASAHGAVACASCHAKHEEYPHPAKVPKPACSQCHARESEDFFQSVHGVEVKKGNAGAPNCAMCHSDPHETVSSRTAEFKKAVPETCGMCHDKALEQFSGSSHGKAAAAGVRDAPVCTDCHTSHQIQRPKDPRSSVFAAAVPDTCGRCHGDLRLAARFGLPSDRLTSFNSSFHGLALKSGRQTVADCASCHGYHNILAAKDPKSMVHPKNLAQTCGHCHPGAGSRFALTSIHEADTGRGGPSPVRYAEIFYLLVIPGTIGLMALHHGGDFIRKVSALRFGHLPVRPALASPHAEVRMHRWERIQHALLALSFIVLAWSGFALRYPDAFWAKGIVSWEATYPLRGVVHRVAAVIMVAVSVLHVISLIVNPKLRAHWMGLLPRVADIREGMEGLAWRLGLRQKKPFQSAHSYIEKAEYWAVVWGTFVMAATGILLWANRWALEMLPKMWLDLAHTIHFYEAVLATLAIIVWHFYSVIFDPEVYPMDTAWFTGRSPREQPSHSSHKSDRT